MNLSGILLVPFLLALSAWGLGRGATEDEFVQHFGKLTVLTHVANYFPNTNATAFLSLGEEATISRIAYSQDVSDSLSLEQQTDFVITFKEVPKEDVISDYTEFGLFEGKFLPESEAVIIIGRDRDQPDKPTHRAIVFHRNIEAESSRLYLFNSVWDGQTEPGDLSFYGLYLRKNFDGSESESVTPLALDVPMSEGRDVELSPGTSLLIKGFYQHVGSVMEFKTAECAVTFPNFVSVAGKRSYLVAFGDYVDDPPPESVPAMRLVGALRNGAIVSTKPSSLVTLTVLVSLSAMMLCQLYM